MFIIQMIFSNKTTILFTNQQPLLINFQIVKIERNAQLKIFPQQKKKKNLLKFHKGLRQKWKVEKLKSRQVQLLINFRVSFEAKLNKHQQMTLILISLWLSKMQQKRYILFYCFYFWRVSCLHQVFFVESFALKYINILFVDAND